MISSYLLSLPGLKIIKHAKLFSKGSKIISIGEFTLISNGFKMLNQGSNHSALFY